MAKTKRKQFPSDVCLDGARIGLMKRIAKSIFQDSFLCIEVDPHERIFTIRIDDRVDKTTIKQFLKDKKLCRIIVYKEIDISLL